MKQKRNYLPVLITGALMAAEMATPVMVYGMDQQTEESDASANEAVLSGEEVLKDETVYVLEDAEGNVNKIIVSDWLQNVSGSQTISDRSELSDIENVKGEEDFSVESENQLIWNADGQDIYYQGTLEKELPLQVSLSCKLDGADISMEDLAGKSGEVSLRFHYQNNQCESVLINGEEETISVPFMVLQGTFLDNDSFRNITVSNGKTINDGTRTIVLGYAFPGVQNNLDLDKEQLEIPDYVEITADVTDFQLGTSVAFASNELFAGVDEESIGSLDDLTGALGELTDGMTSLCDGSSGLYDGLGTLLENANALAEGVGALAEGAEQLNTGAANLDTGAGQLSEGIQQLSTGLESLTANSSSLCMGAEQIFASLLLTAEGQITAAGAAIPSLTMENYADVLNGILASLDETGAMYTQVASLKASLDGVNAFYSGLQEYTAGVDAVAGGAAELGTGAAQLKEGTAQLGIGAESLSGGLKELNGGMPALLEGVTALHDGAQQLSEGLNQFNEDGIQKLANAGDCDMGELIVRLKATIEAAGNYNNFAGIDEEMNGRVKFIYRIDGLEE
ncbi:MAG: hypothetical protein HUJ72_07945 [Blautia sp.]|nr:hypothetical protein [Blautia sp.]